MFPEGKIIEKFNSKDRDFLEYLSFLKENEFTGVIKYFGGKTGNILMIFGEIVGATFGDTGGDDAIKTIVYEVPKGGEVETHELDVESARNALRKYNEIFPITTWNVDDRRVLMKKKGIKEPDKDFLESILVSEGMEHLVKKKKEKIECGWDAVGLMDKYPVPKEESMNILVVGGPSPYKQLWCQNYVYGELMGGKGAIYFNFSTIPQEIRKNFSRFNMSISKFEREGRFLFIDCFPWRSSKSPEKFSSPIDKSTLSDFSLVFSDASKEIEEKSVVVFDSLSHLMIYFDAEQVIKFAINQASKLKELGWTGLFIVEKGVKDEWIENSLKFLLDGVFEVNMTEEKHLGEFKILWIKGVLDIPTTYYFDISKRGMKLTPKR